MVGYYAIGEVTNVVNPISSVAPSVRILEGLGQAATLSST